MEDDPICETKPIWSGRADGGRSCEAPKVVWSGRADVIAPSSLLLLDNAGDERPEAGRPSGDALPPRVLAEGGNG